MRRAGSTGCGMRRGGRGRRRRGCRPRSRRWCANCAGPIPAGGPADRVRGRPAGHRQGAVAGDGAPGAGAQRPGGPAGAAAQAQVQAVAAGDPDGAVAAGPGRRDLPGRRPGMQDAIRHRRPLEVRGLRRGAGGPVGAGGRRRVHRRDEGLRGAVGGADRHSMASSSPAGSPSRARPKCCSSGSAASTASLRS